MAVHRDVLRGEHRIERLTFRFLRLPTLDRYQIALKLGLMREGDDALPPNTVFLEVFQRAVDARRLADLWDETEKRHDDRADADVVAAGGAYEVWPDIERAIDDGYRRLCKPRVNPWLARYHYRGRP